MARKNLFETFDEIVEFYPFSDTIKFSALLPTLRTVERQYFNDLDADTWSALLNQLDTSFTDAYWEELAYIARQAAANLVALLNMDRSNVIYSSAGLLVAKTENTVPASEARTIALRYSLMKLAQTELDSMIQHLEKNTAVFTDWAASEQSKALDELIIKTAGDFDSAYSINENRWIFRKLISKQKMVIDTQAKAYLSAEFLEAYIADPTLPEHIAIKDRLHRGIAHITFAEAVPSLQQQFGPEGIAIFDSNFQQSGSRRDSEDLNRMKLLLDTAMDQGLQELRKLQYFLNENASETKYPEYFASAMYAAPDQDNTDLNDYDEPTNHFAL